MPISLKTFHTFVVIDRFFLAPPLGRLVINKYGAYWGQSKYKETTVIKEATCRKDAIRMMAVRWIRDFYCLTVVWRCRFQSSNANGVLYTTPEYAVEKSCDSPFFPSFAFIAEVRTAWQPALFILFCLFIICIVQVRTYYIIRDVDIRRATPITPDLLWKKSAILLTRGVLNWLFEPNICMAPLFENWKPNQIISICSQLHLIATCRRPRYRRS